MVHPAAIASDMRRGLSTVRPEMRARRLVSAEAGGSSERDLWKPMPFSAVALDANSPNSGPPGPDAPVFILVLMIH